MDDQPKRPLSVRYYRDKAAELLLLAEQATSEQANQQFMALAEHWQRLAQAAEHLKRD